MTINKESTPRAPDLARRRLLALAPAGLLGASPLWLASCGGGVDASIDDDQRMAVLDGLRDALIASADASNAGLAATADAYFAAQPLFAAHSRSTDGAWARFVDGRLVIAAFNRETAPVASAASALAVRPAASLRSRPLAVDPTLAGLIPNAGITLMNTLAPPKYQPAIPNIEIELRDASFKIVVETGSFLEDWMSIGDRSIIVVESHGAVHPYAAGPGHDKPSFGVLQSGNHVSTAYERLYKSDLDAGILTYFTNPDHEIRYGMTSAFFDKYVTFGPNSAVFVNACSLGDPNADFLDVLIKKGAGAAIAWTQPVRDYDAFSTASFVFDRLLGTNAFPPIDSEPVYPLSFEEILDAARSTLNPGVGYAYGTSPVRTGRADLRVVVSTGATLGALLPSIRATSLGAAGPSTVRLTGLFGYGDGAVVEANPGDSTSRPLSVLSWSPTSIDVKLLPTTKRLYVAVADTLFSNYAEIGDGVTLTPATANVVKGADLTVTASAPAVPGGSVLYHWTVAGDPTARLVESPVEATSAQGTTFDSSRGAVVLPTTPATIGPITIALEAFAIVGASKRSLGQARCEVTMVNAAVAISPAVARLEIVGGTQVFTLVSTPPLVAPAGRTLQYEWSCPSVVGTLASGGLATSAAAPSIVSVSAAATYTGNDGLVGGEVERLGCKVFYEIPAVPPETVPKRVDVASATAEVDIKPPFTLGVTPSSGDVPTDSDIQLAASIAEPLAAGTIVRWSWNTAVAGVGAVVPDGGDADQQTSTAIFQAGAIEGAAAFSVSATVTPPSGKTYAVGPANVALDVKKGVKQLVMTIGAGIFGCNDPLACGVDKYTAFIVPRQPKAASYTAVFSGFVYGPCNRSITWAAPVPDGGGCNFPVTYHPHNSRGPTNAWAVWIGFGTPIDATGKCVVTISLGP